MKMLKLNVRRTSKSVEAFQGTDGLGSPSYGDALSSLLLLILVLSTGCSSLTHRIAQTRDTIVSSPQKASLPESAANPPLGDPTHQSLAIALETARLAEQRGMDHEAIAAYRKVRNLNADQPGVAHALAVLYDRSGRVDDAASEYRKALVESPSDPDLLCDHGYFQYSTGDLEQAASSYRQALELSPEHRQTKINLGVLLAQQGDDERAMQLFTDAIGPAAARHNLGMIKLRRGDPQSAKRLLADAASRDPSVAEKSSQVLGSLDRAQGVVRPVSFTE